MSATLNMDDSPAYVGATSNQRIAKIKKSIVAKVFKNLGYSFLNYSLFDIDSKKRYYSFYYYNLQIHQILVMRFL